MIQVPMNLTELASRVAEVAGLLKALARPSRLMLVCTLVEAEYAVGQLEKMLDVHQPTLSQQLRC